MNRTYTIAPEIERALLDAQRTPGWNVRGDVMRRFNLGRCVLYTVPARTWAYHRPQRSMNSQLRA